MFKRKKLTVSSMFLFSAIFSIQGMEEKKEEKKTNDLVSSQQLQLVSQSFASLNLRKTGENFLEEKRLPQNMKFVNLVELFQDNMKLTHAMHDDINALNERDDQEVRELQKAVRDLTSVLTTVNEKLTQLLEEKETMPTALNKLLSASSIPLALKQSFKNQPQLLESLASIFTAQSTQIHVEETAEIDEDAEWESIPKDGDDGGEGGA